MRVVVSEFVTLDGVMQDPGGVGEIEHGGWSMKYGDDESRKFKVDELFRCDGLLLGRVTYQGFAKAWPSMQNDPVGYGKRMNSLPKYVVSTTLERVEWNNSKLLKGDFKEGVSKLKQQAGRDLLVFGSGSLVGQLAKLNLIDEFRLMVYPVTLGSGKRLFGDEYSGLKLMEAKSFPSGIVLLRYKPLDEQKS